ncbi:MAG: GNAT family N-acetyltransferase [Elusimicrobia bacterium]|nr:GNAT family N-acetyltransferase [Elusimicrobiota bacterium]
MATIAAQDILIRALRPEDIDRIVEIDEEVSGLNRREYYEKKFSSAFEGTRPMTISLVAMVEGKPVGFVMGEVLLGEFGIPADTATIDTIGVDPDRQGSGVGRALMEEFRSHVRKARALMEEFRSHVRKAGVRTVFTFVNWNEWGLLRFFESAGFSPGRMVNLELKPSA